MRLKLNEYKIKIRFFGISFIIAIASFVLCGLSLTVFASSTNQIPAPYGFGSSYGYRTYDGANPIPVLLEYLEEHDISCYGLLMYEQASDNSYIDFYVCREDFIYVGSGENGTSWGNYGLDLRDTNLTGVSADLYRVDLNGNITRRDFALDLWGSCSFPSNGTINSDTAYLYYPLYYPDNAPIKLRKSFNEAVYYDGFVFAGFSGGGDIIYEGSSIGGNGTGSFIPSSGSSIGGTFDFDLNLTYDNSEVISGFTRMDDQFEGLKIQLNAWQLLWEAWKTGQQTILNGLQQGINSIIGKLTDIQDGINQVVGVPTPETVTSIAQDSDVMGGFIEVTSNANGLINGIFSDFGSNDIPTSADMDFDYPFHWSVYKNGSFVDHSTTVHISFGWYESIRSKVLLVIGVFMVVGFVVYMIKQVPNIINGVGGASNQIVNRKGGK